MHRYLAEFDFRYSTRVALGVSDKDRAEKALKSIDGKRLILFFDGLTSGPKLIRWGKRKLHKLLRSILDEC